MSFLLSPRESPGDYDEKLKQMMEKLDLSEEEVEKRLNSKINTVDSGGHNTAESALRKAYTWFQRAQKTGDEIKVVIQPSPLKGDHHLTVEGDALEYSEEHENYVRKAPSDLKYIFEALERLKRMDDTPDKIVENLEAEKERLMENRRQGDA